MAAARDWVAILQDAAARGLSAKALAKELGVHNARIYQVEKVYGIALPRRKESRPPTFAEPYVPSDEEQWRVIPGFSNYEASSEGRIRNRRTGHIRRFFVRPVGYYTTQIRNDAGQNKSHDVHYFIALTFIANPLGLAQVNHKDQNKLNNRADNLEWLSREDNFRHGRESGKALAKYNPRVPHKLSPEDVEAIRRAQPANPRLRRNHGIKDAIARQYGVNESYVSKLWSGLKRTHG